MGPTTKVAHIWLKKLWHARMDESESEPKTIILEDGSGHVEEYGQSEISSENFHPVGSFLG